MLNRFNQEDLFVIIDVVIPTLNESKNLDALLPFLKAQLTNDKAKIIVVDSKASMDQSEAICQQHDVLFLKSEHKQRAAQMNLGAMASTADALMFLHADVLPPKDFYNQIQNCLRSKEFGMFPYRFDRKGFKFAFNSFLTQFDGFYAGGGDQCLFIKRSSFEQLNGFEEALEVMEDFHLFERIKKLKLPYAILKSKALVSARKYESNSYAKINWVNLKMFLAFKMGEDPTALNERYARYKEKLK